MDDSPGRYQPPAADRDGTVWDRYVRRVEFLDADPVRPDEPPVHVVRRVLFDGVLAPASIRKDGMTVDLSGDGGTVVTLHAHRDDVQIGNEEPYRPWLIGGRHVLTPLGKGWEWVPVDRDDPENPYVVCSFYVAEAIVR